MSIVKFAFEDELRGWKLTETAFAPFNLLVGASGVGKTRILRSLERVRLAALEGARFAAGCKWSIEVEAEGSKYLWTARTVQVNGSFQENFRYYDDDDDGFETEHARFAEEQIWTIGGTALITRDTNRLTLQGKDLPRIKDTESTIGLLRDVDELRPLYEALCKIVTSRPARLAMSYRYSNDDWIFELETKADSLDELRDLTDLDILTKALILQNKFPDSFAVIVDRFKEIFDQVEEVRVQAKRGGEGVIRRRSVSISPDQLKIAMRERGMDSWLVSSQLSSGMLRTFAHLLNLALATAGTVILIDEFENSLGVNCLPQVADHILGRAGELQFIITSHHPYVINNVPASMWRVVTREGSTVRVLGLEDLPALATASRHDRFTILTNLPEFEHGIQ